MNKSELINAVAVSAEVSKKEAEAVITAALDAITAALKEGDKVQLVGFGSFEVKKRAERVGPQPQDQGGHHHPRLQGACVQGRQGSEGRRQPVRPCTRWRIWIAEQDCRHGVPAVLLPSEERNFYASG